MMMKTDQKPKRDTTLESDIVASGGDPAERVAATVFRRARRPRRRDVLQRTSAAPW
jgi:hypothetical protein